MVNHNGAGEGMPHFWEAIDVPQGFDPEQALRDLSEGEHSTDQDDVLFPALIQLNGTVEEFERDFTELLNQEPGVTTRNLSDLVQNQVEPQDMEGEPGYLQMEAVETAPPLDPNPNGDLVDLVLDGRMLRLMAQSYQDEKLRPLVDRIASISVGIPLKPNSAADRGAAPVRWRVSDAPEGEDPDRLAIVAIIDDGVPFGHDLFRNTPTDTRVEYAWVQDGVHVNSPNVPYGREFDRNMLNNLLVQADNGRDEDAFYRLTGQADFSDIAPRNRLGFSATHGAHVGVMAAGYPRPNHPLERVRFPHSAPDLDVEDPPAAAIDPAENPIIAVQLPHAVAADTSGGNLTPYLHSAVKYIFNRADEIARKRGVSRIPLVINFSFGFLAAPHDGSHLIEKILDYMIALRNFADPGLTEVVIPSGNSRELQCRAEVEFSAAKPDPVKVLNWRVLPDDRTLSYGILYMPHDQEPRELLPNNSRVSVQLATPDGAVSLPVQEIPNTGAVLRNARNQIIGIVYYQYRPVFRPFQPPAYRGQFWYGVRDTHVSGPNDPYAPPGDWQLIVTQLPAMPENTVLDTYIQRDDTQPGYRINGRQSYFSDPGYERRTITGLPQVQDQPDAYCKRDGSLNGIATGYNTITVAAMMENHMRAPGLQPGAVAAPYSSGGPLVGTQNQQPDVAALADKSPASWGMLTGGTRAAGWYHISGTSIAAPKITRRIVRSMIEGTWAGKNASLPTWVPFQPATGDISREDRRIGLGGVPTS